MNATNIVLIGIWFGVLFRIGVPAYRKYLEAQGSGEPFKWDQKYTGTAILGLLVTIPVTLLAFAAFTIPEGSDLMVFILSCVWGFGQEALIIEVMNWTPA